MPLKYYWITNWKLIENCFQLKYFKRQIEVFWSLQVSWTLFFPGMSGSFPSCPAQPFPSPHLLPPLQKERTALFTPPAGAASPGAARGNGASSQQPHCKYSANALWTNRDGKKLYLWNIKLCVYIDPTRIICGSVINCILNCSTVRPIISCSLRCRKAEK